MNIAILGIHTGIGKTVAAAVLAEALGADYWKPVQAGLEETDTNTVKKLLTNGAARVHKEALALERPMSPHAAAAAEGIEIDYTTFQWPATDKMLLVETAGGVLSPMSGSTTMADFVAHYRLPAILVVQNYLGSINHTLLSIEVIKNRGIPLLGLVISGAPNEASESFITQYTATPIIAHIPHLATLNNDTVTQCAEQIKHNLVSNLKTSGIL